MAPAKIAVVGDINGKFPSVFKKIGALHSKNAFSFALVAGNLFADPATSSEEDDENISNLLSGKNTVSLPTYFALGTHALPPAVIEKLESSDGELCPNLYFLGKRTTTKTSDGVKVVALGGNLDTNVSGVSKEKYLPFYMEGDAKALAGVNNTDILITSQWPEGIRDGSKAVFQDSSQPTSQKCVAELCARLKPRYHFSTSQAFYEREPFFHPPTEEAPDVFNVTRFLSIAPFANTDKQKWIYAFSIDPTAAPLVSIPAGTTTLSLIVREKKRPALPDQNSYRFNSGHGGREPYSKKRRRAPPPSQGECFFCLSNPNLATHIITSIGTEAYLTNAKGPLTKSSTFAPLNFPGHTLIIPMAHSPTLSLIPEADSRATTIAEMHRYKCALQDMLTSRSKGSLGAITWEISRSGGFHTHWQFLPLPAETIKSGLVEAAFKVEAENEKYPPFEKGEPDESGDYLRVWLWTPESGGGDSEKGKEGSMIWMPLDQTYRDLQFPRRVVAKLLGLEGRVAWQDCAQTEMEEETDVEAFKEAFKEFDFTEED
ncbi:hypothetical protein EJ08DRAFT_528691 [Tothia fuscella]|uniref:Uncharacterized protein n=1 Tax=Tothia fuscella TaxID=1048955 RepID=A0A9P4NGM6_9PEZI|nr:hypothetical protein EJ08DRAFT_528691 [Tothia fuscella]